MTHTRESPELPGRFRPLNLTLSVEKRNLVHRVMYVAE